MRATAILPALVLLSACGGSGGRGDDAVAGNAVEPASTRSVSSELPKGVKPSASVLEMRRIAGVWRSSPGALRDSPKQSLQLEIAFDRSFTMTLWGKDPKGAGEAVFARQSGRFGETREGFAGSTSNAKPSALSSVASWSARIDKDGAMTLTPSGGAGIPMHRTGN